MRTFEIYGLNWSATIHADTISRENGIASFWSYDSGFVCSIDVTYAIIREI